MRRLDCESNPHLDGLLAISVFKCIEVEVDTLIRVHPLYVIL